MKADMNERNTGTHDARDRTKKAHAPTAVARTRLYTGAKAVTQVQL